MEGGFDYESYTQVESWSVISQYRVKFQNLSQEVGVLGHFQKIRKFY